MSKEIISTDKAPAAIGPYSQGVKTGNLVFTSGQLPIDPVTGELVTEIKAATTTCLNNCAAILAQAGTSLDNVVKAVVFLKDLNDFAPMNEVYAEFFKNSPPARSCFQVGKLPKDAVVEIEVVAVV